MEAFIYLFNSTTINTQYENNTILSNKKKTTYTL